MSALAWTGVVLLALALLAYVVFKVTIWFAAVLFIAGLALMIWGAVRVKRAL